MQEYDWTAAQAARTLGRLWPRLAQASQEEIAAQPEAWEAFTGRLRHEWPRLFRLLLPLYGQQYDFFYHLEQLLLDTARSWFARSAPLKALDVQREAEPDWFQSEGMVGGVLYVDLFAGTFEALHAQVPYLQELGLTYLHLMPVFEAPEGNSDGGYAVSSYRRTHPRLGTIEELGALAATLRGAGISLVVDFVFNHTSDEHDWAQRAQAGDPEAQEFYLLFPDRERPDAYERTLREIFPAVRRGSFSWHEGMRRWVWTTFNNFQWDLNYSNPAVFRAMVGEMLFLANQGVEVLRMDAVAFIWKRLGTSCENLPEAHLILQAFNAVARIAAPALLFKSEAIVHPDEVIQYVRPDECQLSYNPLLMALLWESLATREVRLLEHSLRHRWPTPPGTAWVNYLRSHDDIGWTFDDGDAWHLGINSYDHRLFLNRFYTGRFPGTFAHGVSFQENPNTGDARICGTLASLAGLEQALGEPEQVDVALRRILMLHSIILTIGGVPLLYLGDEVGTLNDYRYRSDPAKAEDSRWVHRPARDAAKAARRHDPATVEGRLFAALSSLIRLRKGLRALWDGAMEVVPSGNPHLLAFLRQHAGQRLLVLANFSEHPQTLDAERLRVVGAGSHFHDLVSEQRVAATTPLQVEPYGFMWLVEREA